MLCSSLNRVNSEIVKRAPDAIHVPIQSVFLGNRVALRAPKVSDAQRLVEIQLDSLNFLTPWVPARSPEAFDVGATRTRILQDRRDFKADRHYKFCFTLGPNGPIIGRVALSQVFRGIFQNAYLGYYVDVRYQRQGLTSEAVRLALDTAFGPLRLHRLQAAIMPHNEASLALIRSVGFRLEGKAERYLQIAGGWQDHLLFALTAEEWKRTV
jgi:ribosomal-protein-alanine N-acetyltransferase